MTNQNTNIHTGRAVLMALLFGVAAFSGAGVASADAIEPAEAQSGTVVQSKVAIDERVRAPAPIVLTDNQMNDITAGHWINKPRRIWHDGWFITFYDGHWRTVYGPHFGVYHQ